MQDISPSIPAIPQLDLASKENFPPLVARTPTLANAINTQDDKKSTEAVPKLEYRAALMAPAPAPAQTYLAIASKKPMENINAKDTIKAIRVDIVPLNEISGEMKQQAVALPSQEPKGSATPAGDVAVTCKEELLAPVSEVKVVVPQDTMADASIVVVGQVQDTEEIPLVSKAAAPSEGPKKKKKIQRVIASAAALVGTCINPTAANRKSKGGDEKVVKVDKALSSSKTKKKKKEKKATKSFLRQIFHNGAKKKEAPVTTVENEENKETKMNECCTEKELPVVVQNKLKGVGAEVDGAANTAVLGGEATPAAAAAEEMEVEVEVQINVLSEDRIELRFNYRQLQVETLEENWACFDTMNESDGSDSLDQNNAVHDVVTEDVEVVKKSEAKKKKKSVGAALRRVFHVGAKKAKEAAPVSAAETEVEPEKKERKRFAGASALKSKANACGRKIGSCFAAAKVAMMKPIR